MSCKNINLSSLLQLFNSISKDYGCWCCCYYYYKINMNSFIILYYVQWSRRHTHSMNNVRIFCKIKFYSLQSTANNFCCCCLSNKSWNSSSHWKVHLTFSFELMTTTGTFVYSAWNICYTLSFDRERLLCWFSYSYAPSFLYFLHLYIRFKVSLWKKEYILCIKTEFLLCVIVLLLCHITIVVNIKYT